MKTDKTSVEIVIEYAEYLRKNGMLVENVEDGKMSPHFIREYRLKVLRENYEA